MKRKQGLRDLLMHGTALTALLAGCSGAAEPSGAAATVAGDHKTSIAGDAARSVTVTNLCGETVWVGQYPPTIGGGGWRMDPATTTSFGLPTGWNGRFWGRRRCSFDGNGNGSCETGDCGGTLQCSGRTGAPPTSLAEFNLNSASGQDWYDVSLVDGYDFPIQVTPSDGNCRVATCTSDLLATCPAVLQERDSAGNLVACKSACTAFDTDEYCCRGAYGTPATCNPAAWGIDYAAIFKGACPSEYSYAYDDPTSLFTCGPPFPSYSITFCPGGTGGGGGGGGISPSTWYNVINQNSTKCVDESGWGTANGTPVQQYGCGDGQANQQWQFHPTDSGFYNVAPRYAPYLGWDVTGGPGATGDGAKIELWGVGGSGGTNQQWQPVALGGGSYKFIARHSGKCLDVPGSAVDNGVVLQQWDCNGTQAQSFLLVPVN